MKITKKQIDYSLKVLTYIKPDFAKYEDLNDGYYHILTDLLLYPRAWLYAAWSKRGPGKTYSFLWFCYYNEIKFIYMKRTNQDVDLILKDVKALDFDPSPYKALKRDKHIEVIGVKIDEGLGAFYEPDEEGQPKKLLCYVLSFNKVQQYKGFDFSDVEFICFDEFIPQAGERIKRAEGSLLLDLYMTVSRDRLKRGRPALKLVIFANAEQISTPVTNELEIVDSMADLNASGEPMMYLENRLILLHHITNEEVPISEEEKDGIYIGMQGTSWFEKSFNGSFVNNDFSNVTKRSIKRCIPLVEVLYKTHKYFIYYNEEKDKYYMCSIPANARNFYNLNRENEQKKFYIDFVLDLCEACIEERFKFEKYSMYDLIINYRKFFNVSY